MCENAHRLCNYVVVPCGMSAHRLNEPKLRMLDMDNWDEVKTALHVARIGTVSGAAEVLGVHHATVIRHIDALEERLGVKLFQRHPRGYTATEAGEDLCRVAQTAQEQFAQFASRARGQGNSVSGELVVTTLSLRNGPNCASMKAHAFLPSWIFKRSGSRTAIPKRISTGRRNNASRARCILVSTKWV